MVYSRGLAFSLTEEYTIYAGKYCITYYAFAFPYPVVTQEDGRRSGADKGFLLNGYHGIIVVF